MLYTFCPNCGTKTDWAVSCSTCGAAIPLYKGDQILKADAVTPVCHGPAQAKLNASVQKSESPLLPAIIGLGAIVVIILGVTLLP